MARINLDVKEIAAVLAGLRLLQTHYGELKGTGIEDIFTNGGEFRGLGYYDIDALCQRINFGDEE